MKRLILRVAVMVLTFMFGIGIERIMSRQAAPQHPAPQPIAPVVTETAEPTVATTAVTVPPEGISTSTSAVILDYNTGKFFPDGEYHMMGERPLELREFDWMDLELSEVKNGRTWGYISVQTKTGNTYGSHEAAFGLVTSRRVFFVTSSPESRVSYRFDGEFLLRDLRSAMNKDKAVLRGTLTKTLDGRKVAEHVVSFRLEFHGC